MRIPRESSSDHDQAGPMGESESAPEADRDLLPEELFVFREVGESGSWTGGWFDRALDDETPSGDGSAGSAGWFG